MHATPTPTPLPARAGRALRTALLLLPTPLALLPLGCPLVTSGGGTTVEAVPPEIELVGVALTEAPSEVEIASWSCHDQLNAVGDLLCDNLLGAAPSVDPGDPASIRFTFRIDFDVTNSNPFPIPLVELLLELSVFSGRVQQGLGGVCVTFCDPQRPAECNLAAAGGCRTDQFPEGGTAGLQIDPVALVEDLIALATGESESLLDNLYIRTLPAGGSTRVQVSVSIDPVSMLEILQEVLFHEVEWSRLSQGQIPEVEIPYQIKGFLWFDIGNFGRVWVAFGPFGDDWDLLRD